MQAALAVLITALVYALHQDVWFWRAARPLVFGFLPIGLFYHAAYTAAMHTARGALKLCAPWEEVPVKSIRARRAP